MNSGNNGIDHMANLAKLQKVLIKTPILLHLICKGIEEGKQMKRLEKLVIFGAIIGSLIIVAATLMQTVPIAHTEPKIQSEPTTEPPVEESISPEPVSYQRSSTQIYDASVYIDGSQVIAKKRNGQIICSGTKGTDDGKVIQAAVDSTDGGTVLIKAGTYILKKPIRKRGCICIDKADIHLMGEGDDTVLRIVSLNDEYAICVYGWEQVHPTNVLISDLCIESAEGGGYGGIWLFYADNCRIDHVRVRNTDPQSIIAQEGVYIEGDNNIITNCSFSGLKAHAINIQGAATDHEPRHRNNTVTGCVIKDCYIGVKVGYQRGAHDNTFTDITIEGCWQGISVRAGANNNQFEDIDIVNTKTDAIRLAEGFPSNNTFKNISIRGGGPHEAIVLGGENGQYNTFYNVTVRGYLGTAVQALEGGSSNTFDRCTFVNNRAGIATYQDALRIINCRFDDEQTVPTQQFGVSIAGTAKGTLIEGSYFGDHVWTAIFDRGTNTEIRNCEGI
jgi:hypothetical protein